MKRLLKLLCALLALCLMAGPAAFAAEEKVDFGGKTLKVAIWYEPEIPTLGNSDSEDAWYYSLKHACEEYNCKVEWIVNTQETHFNKFIQMSLSGEVYADIMMCHSWNYVSLIQQGLILPTTEYITSAPDSEYWNQTTSSLFGETWGIEPKNLFYEPTYYFLFNKKLLNSLGLENPQKLALEGKWDWETFRHYCAAATDPSKEQYGVGSFLLASMLKTGNNFDYAAVDEEGRYHNAFTYSKTKAKGMEVLEMIQKMALEDKSILGDWVDGQEAMDQTINAFKDGKLLFAFYPNLDTLKKSGFSDYSIVTVPVGPSCEELNDTVGAFAFWCLPKESDFSASDRAKFWMEARRTWDPADKKGYFEADDETILDERLDKKYIAMEDAEFMLEMGKQIELYPAVSLDLGSLVADDIFGMVIRGTSTPSAVIQATDGRLQAIIDATYNNYLGS